ncbi:MAG: ABC transporter substrate-binding protein [Chloroflexi bacterium]|nr:ABC transporter substrate-binding protein [Chloroflexota bacterium]MBK6712487.1 ABC transporter substrate-binding protein [Chloroflexota bacterium]MBK7178321.1 ABC transporter substrate-binding protein [Chloroflexota bacterium]MBK7916431.1 ABC transporter substrate-binding protein [Chloroflexota bacterium]MBK8933810.1 ABC transporter substrate-binding protein [Chloroflexota bacterium]
MQMDRTRVIFIAIVGLALIIACVAGALTMFSNNAATPTPVAQVATTAATTASPTRPSTNLQSPEPIWGPNYDANDGLPTYICGADAFGSYFTLQQMQMAGIDKANGFHLGIVPFALDGDPKYEISEEQRTALLNSGVWDCLLTTLDSVALTSPGVITAIVDESAGADQLWGRNIETINDMQGKRIAFSRGSVGEYFVYYTLSIAQLSPRSDVTLVPQDTVADAIAAFNSGQADVVSGWEPDIYDAESSGGLPLLSSAQLRIVIDTIVTSRDSIQNQPDLVQNFHNAWFATLKAQVEDFDTAASQIAAWGHNDWSFVYPETASTDFNAWLESVAQADLGDNAFVMRDMRPIIDRLNIARRVWAASDVPVPSDTVDNLVNPGFVIRAAEQASLQPNGNPVNNTFSISQQLDLSGVTTSASETLVVLPCRTFTFLPESTELTLESRRILDNCVVPTLSQSVGLFLKVVGSSAWPANNPPYTETDILEVAEGRAQSVVDYLVSKGIDPARFIIEAALPPEDHRNTSDANLQAADRYVELTLITVGR